MGSLVPLLYFRLILPAILFIACIFRPSILSALYGLALLAWPFIPGASHGKSTACTKRYVIVCIIISAAAVLAQAVFHIVLAATPPYGSVLQDRPSLAGTLRFFGLHPLNIPSAGHIVRLICPDIVALCGSIGALIILIVYDRKTTSVSQSELPMPVTSRQVTQSEGANSQPECRPTENSSTSTKRRKDSGFWKLATACILRLSEILVVALMLAAGVIYPSLLSCVYFFVFLIVMTWWALHRKSSPTGITYIKLALAAYAAIHLALLYMYQLEQFQDAVPSGSLTARLLGLTPIINATDGTAEPWSITFVNNLEWPVIANPVVIFVFYIYVAFQTICTFKVGFETLYGRQHAIGTSRVTADDLSSIHEELLSHESEEETGANSNQERPAAPSAGAHDRGPEGATSQKTNEKRSGTYMRLFSFGAVSLDWRENSVINALVAFVIRHTYALALVMMMAWAITYHSWLSFIWLALACIIWMMGDSRKSCFYLSPFIVFYAQVLLCLQYVYGLNLNESEIPSNASVGGVPLAQIGLSRPVGTAACVPLFVKALFAIPFWITLRLFLYEQRNRRNVEGSTSYGTFETFSTLSFSTGFCGTFLAKYWIYVVGLTLLLISVRTPVVAYEVCYMVFFVVLITVLQVSFTIWRLMLFVYWMVLSAFSIAVLLLVYTFQFAGVPGWWHKWTGWSNDSFADVGLESYEATKLFVQLLTPISFLIVVILQLKFFHNGFMRLTNFTPTSNSAAVSVRGESATTPKKKWMTKLYSYYEMVSDLLWRIAELHFGKLVAFGLMMLAVTERSPVNGVLVIIVCCMLPLRRLHTLFSVIATIWVSLVIVAKMLYQMRFAKVEDLPLYDGNCSWYNNSRKSSIDPATWAGFSKLGGEKPVAAYLQGYIIVLVLLTLQAVVKLHQKYYRQVMNRPTPARGVLFPGIGRQEADEGIIKCLKYLANYGFYKFGVEITFIVLIIVIGVRMDSVAFLYAIWLMGLLALPRRTLAHFWGLFVLFITVAIPVEYASVVGFPPTACIEYPWHAIPDNLVEWLYLPTYTKIDKPNSNYLVGDFFLLLMACCQLYVFRVELSSSADTFEGGDNSPIPVAKVEGEHGRSENPTPDFITYTKSYLDMVKVFIFVYFQWITLIMVFVAGVGGISGFAFGYLVAAFALLWKGNDLYLEPHNKVMLRWYILLFYNVFAIMLKIGLQVVGCAYRCNVCNTEFHWVIQLFSIYCLRGDHDECADTTRCEVSKEEAEILYDGICFAFLILQLRIFSSWYFRHSIAEFRTERVLSARGAFLINQLIKKNMRSQQEKEDQILQKVKLKTERIREHYLKHMEGKKHFEPKTYGETKRGGDYYMFDYDSDRGSDTEELDEQIGEEPADAKDGDEKDLGVGQLLYLAGQKDFDLEKTVEVAEQQKEGEQNVELSTDATDTKEIALQLPKDDTEEDVKTDEKQKRGKVGAALKFLQLLGASFLKQLASSFNRWSKDYICVAFVLKEEKHRLKETMIKELDHDTDFRRVRETIFNQEVSRRVHRVQNETDLENVAKQTQKSWSEHNVVMRFLISTYYLLLSHTELLCYFMIIIDHMCNASIISLPLPLLTFFWGTLCSPRPPKFFWVTLITYTEAMIVVKFMFQFGFWQFDTINESPFVRARILGIERKSYYAAYDVALLMILFFHRYVLKTLGLWKDVTDNVDLFEDDLVTARSRTASVPSMVSARDGKADVFELQDLAGEQITSTISLQEGICQDELENQEEAENTNNKKQGCLAYFASMSGFFRRLLHPVFRYIMDLYSWMFLCDVICFLILAFGYSSFGEIKGSQYDVLADISANKVPIAFVIMLIVLMILIIIDRAIYLSKSIIAKLVFQFLLVTAVHGWLFFGLPAFTDRKMSENRPAQLWYFVKCIYFLMSAWQIRNGYPSRIQGNLLTKKYGLTNYSFFTLFMAAPFLFELRTLIDWTWIETSMPLFDYITMENMYATVFRLKCMRNFEKDYPVPRGVPKGKLVKYGMGLPFVILIVVLLWLPLLLFALVNAIGNIVPVVHAQFAVTIEGYPPLYLMESQRAFLQQFKAADYAGVEKLCGSTKACLSFVRGYWPKDIYEARFRESSNKAWWITEPSMKALVEDLNSTTELSINFDWEFRRSPQDAVSSPLVHTIHNSYKLEVGSPERLQLVEILNKTRSDPVVIPRAFAPFIVLPSAGAAQPAAPILNKNQSTAGDPKAGYVNLKLSLNTSSEVGNETIKYWEVKMDTPEWYRDYLPPEKREDIVIAAFVDRVFPSALNSVTNGGIISAYVVLVYAAGRLIRSLIANSPLDVILAEMPDVDRVVQLCLDLYLVREARDFFLEQDLFAKLIFLFRSPETLIRWTRPKVE